MLHCPRLEALLQHHRSARLQPLLAVGQPPRWAALALCQPPIAVSSLAAELQARLGGMHKSVETSPARLWALLRVVARSRQRHACEPTCSLCVLCANTRWLGSRQKTVQTLFCPRASRCAADKRDARRYARDPSERAGRRLLWKGASVHASRVLKFPVVAAQPHPAPPTRAFPFCAHPLPPSLCARTLSTLSPSMRRLSHGALRGLTQYREAGYAAPLGPQQRCISTRRRTRPRST